MNSLTLYNDACNFVGKNPNAAYWQKNFYMQIVTTIFYELLTQKNSPLLSKFCADNGINNLNTKNFKIVAMPPNFSLPNSFDMYLIVYGLNVIFSKNLYACANAYDEEFFQKYIFRGQMLRDNYAQRLFEYLQKIDDYIKNFQQTEKIVSDEESTDLMKSLDKISQNRILDDEKIVDEIKKVQQTLQDELNAIQQNLKQVAEIRDGIDYRGMKEPIYQLIQLYRKLDDNLKRHPMEDKEKGYAALIKRCESFLKYVTQSLKMLGVEIIDDTGKIFNPDRNKVADDAPVSLNSTVAKIVKVGFAYKGQIIERSLVVSG